MVPAGSAKRRGLATVEIRRHQGQLGFELAEIVAAAFLRKKTFQLLLHVLAGKDASRQARPQFLQRLGKGFAPGGDLPQGRHQQRWQHDAATRKFSVGRHHQPGRVEGLCQRAVVFNEQRTKFPRRNAVGQAGGNKTTGRNSDVVLQLGEVDPVKGLFQSTQCTNFVNGAQGPAT